MGETGGNWVLQDLEKTHGKFKFHRDIKEAQYNVEKEGTIYAFSLPAGQWLVREKD